VGISSSFHIARFFGLTATAAQPDIPANSLTTSSARMLPIKAESVQPRMFDRQQSKQESEDVAAKYARSGPAPRVDIGAVIAKALEAAGLIRRQ
jgi:hypothetical protein